MMPERKDEDSSSEDEFCKDALREAIDHQFVKDEYFSQKKNTVSKEILDQNNENHIENSVSKTDKPKSLRKKEEEERFENFGVSTTFQKFVAKKLDEILEKSIELKHTKGDLKNQKSERTTDHGSIKLLSSCVEFLTAEEEPVDQGSRKRPRKEEKGGEKKNLSKCKEVAVSPDWILSKTETKAWSNKQKGVQFKYKKLKNGTLTEVVTNSFHSLL